MKAITILIQLNTIEQIQFFVLFDEIYLYTNKTNERCYILNRTNYTFFFFLLRHFNSWNTHTNSVFCYEFCVTRMLLTTIISYFFCQIFITFEKMIGQSKKYVSNINKYSLSAVVSERDFFFKRIVSIAE